MLETREFQEAVCLYVLGAILPDDTENKDQLNYEYPPKGEARCKYDEEHITSEDEISALKEAVKSNLQKELLHKTIKVEIFDRNQKRFKGCKNHYVMGQLFSYKQYSYEHHFEICIMISDKKIEI